MNLILRKNDSATSLLLFIYNNFMDKTKKDYIKLSSLLEIIKVFGKNETAIRMSLSRAAKAGVLTNSKQDNEVYYTLTNEGKKAIRLWNEGVAHFWKRYKLRNSGWDKNWYFINFDFKESKKNIRPEFLDKLEQLGFAQININTWISPYHQNEEVRELIGEYGLDDGVVEIYGEMKIHKDMNRFIDEVYGIRKLKTKYKEFIDTYKSRLVEISKIYEDKDFVNNGLALPILQELGWSFFETSSLDAVLPKEVLPEWEGDKAAYIMRELREMLLEASYRYLEKFE